jgi:flagellar protein FliL
MARLLPLVGAAVIALLLGGGAGWYFGFANAPKTVVVAAEEPQYVEYEIHDRIVNLADQGGRRYLKLSMALQVQLLKAGPEATGGGLVFTSYESAPSESMEAAASKPGEGGVLPNLPRVHDALTTVLSAKRADEVSSAAGKERLKDELKAAINRVLPPDHQVVKVYFTEFIIQ